MLFVNLEMNNITILLLTMLFVGTILTMLFLVLSGKNIKYLCFVGSFLMIIQFLSVYNKYKLKTLTTNVKTELS